jgi:hypothetical protein
MYIYIDISLKYIHLNLSFIIIVIYLYIFNRWLRLIVDEGHEMGHQETPKNPSSSTPHSGTQIPKTSKNGKKNPKKNFKKISNKAKNLESSGSIYNSVFLDASPSSAFISHIAAERRYIYVICYFFVFSYFFFVFRSNS